MTTPDAPPTRHIVVVDTETTGLDHSRHLCVEVAWWNLSTGERDCFIPPHTVSAALATASVDALRINRYIDRIAGQPQDHDRHAAIRLAQVLNGNTLAGSNPAFDAAFLTSMYNRGELGTFGGPPAWHHRMWDLAPYAAGVLGLDHLPGLAEVCEVLAVQELPDHSAEADVTATGLCFLALFERAGINVKAGAS